MSNKLLVIVFSVCAVLMVAVGIKLGVKGKSDVAFFCGGLYHGPDKHGPYKTGLGYQWDYGKPVLVFKGDTHWYLMQVRFRDGYMEPHFDVYHPLKCYPAPII